MRYLVYLALGGALLSGSAVTSLAGPVQSTYSSVPPTPAIPLYGEAPQWHYQYCPQGLPKTDAQRMNVDIRNAPGLRVWCYGDQRGYYSDDMKRVLDYRVNGARYYMCFDASGKPAGTFANLCHDTYGRGYVVCGSGCKYPPPPLLVNFR